MQRPSGASEHEYTINWGARDWVLRPAADLPGLYFEDLGPLLSLEGLAETGRFEPGALSGASLVSVESRFNRIIATYEPPGWGDMFVRASWGPSDDQAIDLEVQVHVLSVGRLHAVEVLTGSRHGPGMAGQSIWVAQPRDARAAALSYDGREQDLAAWTTLPSRGREPADPWLVADPVIPGLWYAELAHPDDESRCITGEPARVRHALFGYDLERGVVLRGRLRGLWLAGADREQALEDQLRRFLDQPPPLST